MELSQKAHRVMSVDNAITVVTFAALFVAELRWICRWAGRRAHSPSQKTHEKHTPECLR